jgi:cobalt-zinc-cadmium efflux system membrane fusion protein
MRQMIPRRMMALPWRPAVGLAALLMVPACSAREAGHGASRETNDSAKHEATAQGHTPMRPSPEVTFTAAQVQHGGVHWGTVSMGTAAAAATVPGQIIPNEDRTARLGAPGRGRVVAVRVAPGDRIHAGQLLVTLQSPEAGTAQSDLAKAEAQVTAARAQATYGASARSRAERLLALKAIPRQDYERAVADDEMAQSGLRQAEAELRRARSTAAALGAGTGAGAEIVLRAPAAGVVLARTAVPGTVVEAGAPLVVITDPSTLWLTISAPEAMASFFRVGGRLRFVVPAFPGDSFVACIDAVGAGLDPETRTLPVRAIVASAGGRLRPEMLASVRVEGARPVAAALVPEDAVQTIDGKSMVFLATPDGKGGAKFVAREVDIAARTNGRVGVTRGLAGGEVVVLTGAFAVKAQLAKAAMPEMEM